MKRKSLIYRLFLFLSTFTRGLVEVFSLVLLYQKGYSVTSLFFFLFVLYFVGIFVNYISLRVDYKKVLIGSSLLYGGSFFYMLTMKNTYFSLVFLGILLSFSNYSYHVVRHYLACTLLGRDREKTGSIVMIMYLGVIGSSLMGMLLFDRLSSVWSGGIVMGLSFLGLLPLFWLKEDQGEKKRDRVLEVKLKKKKILFSIFEQFKVMFLEIQPLFLYLYVQGSVKYVGIFNIILNVASLIVVYFLASKVRKEWFLYICLGLAVVFVLKLNMRSSTFLLGLAFFEGVFVKLYENFSLGNLYDYSGGDFRAYLLLEELIFFVTKSLFMLLVCLCHFSIYVVLYVCIGGIIGSGFCLGGGKNADG